MLVKKAYIFRIYPDPKQIELINKTIGCARFVYNYFVGKQKDKDAYWHIVNEMVQNGQLPQNNWKSGFFNKNKSIKALPELKQNYPFIKEVDSIALQKSVEVVNDSYTRYYKKQNGEPRFKSKKNPVQSYTTKFVNGNIQILNKKIKLPKLGLVRFAKSREVEGRIMNATIRRNHSGKYFISILAETEVEHLEKNRFNSRYRRRVERLCYTFRWNWLWKSKILRCFGRKICKSTTYSLKTTNRFF